VIRRTDDTGGTDALHVGITREAVLTSDAPLASILVRIAAVWILSDLSFYLILPALALATIPFSVSHEPSRPQTDPPPLPWPRPGRDRTTGRTCRGGFPRRRR
jgi:hypothetical protein